eukprot:CAMPEP_0182862258 /NCGR_PEP_ID=MMETSP0034_2-20130328/5964_1 /TAXON_ID=156128 /ORGANISM="Nephroselmis pyriformis, Strain CCMP717" /LENGTH=45 /DNA_ID= /DNA_START= /DNA_END= /DNA_ORIENTATION=
MGPRDNRIHATAEEPDDGRAPPPVVPLCVLPADRAGGARGYGSDA